MLFCFLSGCRDTEADRLHGDWKADISPKQVVTNNSAETAETSQFMHRQLVLFVLKFRKHGKLTLEMSRAGQVAIREQGSWQLVDSIDPVLKLVVEIVRDGKRLQRQLDVELGTDPDRIYVTEINGDHRVGQVAYHRESSD